MIEDALNNYPKIEQVLYYGGKSSAKSFTICQYIAKRGVEKRENAMLFRKESARVKGTIKRSFDMAINTVRLNESWLKLDREFRTDEGAEVFLAGLDNEDKAKGTEGINYVLYDELNQFSFNEYNQTILSLRGQGRKIFFGTWNPVSKNHWLKTDLIDKYEWLPTKYNLPNPESSVRISSCGAILLIHTNYLDNYWTVGSPCGTYGFNDEKLIARYERMRNNPSLSNQYRVNVLGLWGNSDRGGEFYKTFNYATNVIKRELAEYDSDMPLHISFDENTMPYVTLSVYQAKEKEILKIDEVCMKHPFNTLRHTLDEFVKRYKGHNLRLYIYGDRTSKKADSKLQKGQNFYTIIADRLKKEGFKITMRIPSKNPSIHLRKEFINDLLFGDVESASFKISDKCQNTIDDYENLKEAPDGTKHKSMTTHPITKIRYQEYGHCSDTDDYFICEYLKEDYSKYKGTESRKYKKSVGFKV